jgi:hypothetical protein
MIKIQTTDRVTGAKFNTWVRGRVGEDGTLIFYNDPGDNITAAWDEAGRKLTIPQPDKMPPVQLGENSDSQKTN